jgi:crotonobetainyl-CoA:carnitine CoA-transferase CaiB-like acyl-CoA transferase
MRVRVTDHAGQPVDLLGSPIHWTGTELPMPTFPPKVGEHTDEVLKEVLGLDAKRLSELRTAGVVA